MDNMNDESLSRQNRLSDHHPSHQSIREGGAAIDSQSPHKGLVEGKSLFVIPLRIIKRL